MDNVVEVLKSKYQERLELSDDQFEKLLIKIYGQSYKYAIDSKDLINRVMKILEDNLERKLSQGQFHDYNDIYFEVSSFIENNFVISDDNYVNLEQLKSLSTFINSKNIKNKCELYTKLLEKSSKFLDVFKSLVNGKSIEFEQLSSIAQGDKDVMNMLSVFCSYFGINIYSSDISLENYSSLKLYYNQIKKFPVMEKEDFIDTFLRYKNGDKKAFDQMVYGNLLLVLSVINSKFYCNESDMLDFIQVGNLGLMHAIRRYDISKGTEFSTYAYDVIYGYIMQYIFTNNVIKPSKSDVNTYYKIKKTIDSFQASHNRKPTISQLEDSLSIKSDKIKSILNMFKSIDTISLNSYVTCPGLDDTNETDSLEEMFSFGENIDNDVIDKISKEKISTEIFNSLTEAERLVIKYIFAFDGGEMLTYNEIARLIVEPLGLSRPYTKQNISLIYKKAIDKIRVIYLRHCTPEEKKILMKSFY